MLKLAESLEDLDDVQNFYANFDISEEEMESSPSGWTRAAARVAHAVGGWGWECGSWGWIPVPSRRASARSSAWPAASCTAAMACFARRRCARSPLRLCFLHSELLALVRAEAPEVVVVERVFLAANPRSALVLGQARGAVLASLGEAGVQVVRALGAAGQEIRHRAPAPPARRRSRRWSPGCLASRTRPRRDAADALALALTWAPGRAARGSARCALGGARPGAR